MPFITLAKGLQTKGEFMCVAIVVQNTICTNASTSRCVATHIIFVFAQQYADCVEMETVSVSAVVRTLIISERTEFDLFAIEKM